MGGIVFYKIAGTNVNLSLHIDYATYIVLSEIGPGV